MPGTGFEGTWRYRWCCGLPLCGGVKTTRIAFVVITSFFVIFLYVLVSFSFFNVAPICNFRIF